MLPLSQNLAKSFHTDYNFCSTVDLNYYFSMGRPRPLFDYFRSFQRKFYKKSCGRQQDLNSDRRRRPLDQARPSWKCVILNYNEPENTHLHCKEKYHCTADSFGFICFVNVYSTTDLLVWSNPNQSSRRSAVGTVILPLKK